MCASIIPSRRKLSGLDCACIRRHDETHVEFQWRASESNFGAYFDVGVTSAVQNVNVKDNPGPNEFLDSAGKGTFAIITNDYSV
jgi:hypothetical protein